MANNTSDHKRWLRSGLSGIPRGYMAVTPSDTVGEDNCGASCIGIYANTGGAVRIRSDDGSTFTVSIPTQTPFPIIARQVFSTGTTATGIFAAQG